VSPANYCHLHKNSKSKSSIKISSPYKPLPRKDVATQGLFEYKDANLVLLESLNDNELVKMCQTNKYYAQLCNDDFFRNRIGKRYPSDLNWKPQDTTWKQYYYDVAGLGTVSIPLYFGEAAKDKRHKLFNIVLPRSIINTLNPKLNSNITLVIRTWGVKPHYEGTQVKPAVTHRYVTEKGFELSGVKQFGETIVHQLNNMNNNNPYFTINVKSNIGINQSPFRNYRLVLTPLPAVKQWLKFPDDISIQVELFIFVNPNKNNQITSLVIHDIS
jgi:hypothetical protein